MLILASESPRRRELLSRLGVEFTVEPACVDELEEGNDLSLLPEKNALYGQASEMEEERRQQVRKRQKGEWG